MFRISVVGFLYENTEKIRLTSIHVNAPKRVGRAAAISIQRVLPVSFFTEISVVEQGKCAMENIRKQSAVFMLQPLAVSMAPTSVIAHASVSSLPEV